MPISRIFAETSQFIPLALPSLALGLAFRRKKGDDGEEEPTVAYQLLIESTFDGILALNDDGQVNWADDRFLNLMHLKPDAVEKHPFISLIDPGDAEKMQQYLSQSLEHPQQFEVHAIDLNGSVHILKLSTVAFTEDDETEVYVGVRDISEDDVLRKRIEFTEKMDLLKRVMDSIGGDLGPIIEVLSPMVEKGEDPKISQTLKRLADLEERIELFPRRGIQGGLDVHIPELITMAAATITEDYPGLCNITLDLDEGIFPVFGDADQLTEAIRNVMMNACQAAEVTGGDVQVACKPLSVDRAMPRRGFILLPGEYVHICITDSGPGMLPEILDHVFDPLFSTRMESPLAGLGLAVTYTVIKNHRGYVDIESLQGAGTTVEMFLPRSRIRLSIEDAAEIPSLEATTEEAEPEVIAEVEEEIVTEEVVEPDAEEAEPEVEEVIEEEPVIEEEEEEIEAEEEEEETEEPAVTEELTEEEVVTEAEVPPGEEEVLDEAEITSLSGHETILIIEEDNDIRSELEQTLSSFGYNALPARNWVEGIDLYKRHGHIVDLVLLNVQAPEMMWVKTLMDLRKVAPEARVRLMGGDETSATMERYLQMPGISYLMKPITTAGLMRGVRRSLDETIEGED